MKKRPDLNKLAKEVFQANKAKGFHDNEIGNESLLMLVITELSEAVEADRKEKRFSLEKYEYETMTECQGWLTSDEKFKNVFENQVKDTLEDELAGVVIRLLDLIGVREIEIDYYNNQTRGYLFSVADNNFFTKSFPEIIFAVCKTVLSNKDIDIVIKQTLISIEWVCQHFNIDLWLHVELKMKYNQLRPHKHNKNY